MKGNLPAGGAPILNLAIVGYGGAGDVLGTAIEIEVLEGLIYGLHLVFGLHHGIPLVVIFVNVELPACYAI